MVKARAKNIWILFKGLRQIDQGDAAERAEGQIVADMLTSPSNEHTNCLRSFRRLYQTDWQEAEAIYLNALECWRSVSP